MVALSSPFTPAYLKGIVVHPENPFKFDFIVYRGDQPLSDAQKRVEYSKLTKYFLASLAIPDTDQWVNLSPYEKDRIIKDDFGKTIMGRDLLAQDYLLKQITASLIYPQNKLGKTFWDKVYAQAQKQYGTTNIPVNTFNKVWILPDDALIYEKGDGAYVLKNHLKVMLEEDYLALKRHSESAGKATHSITSKIIRSIILPALEKEINEGQNFAPLRQVYSGMLLAAWYKRTLKRSILAQIYANKGKVKGLGVTASSGQAGTKQSLSIEDIYQRYLEAYKKGVFNFIKDDAQSVGDENVRRKYFSGGVGSYDMAQVAFGRDVISKITERHLGDEAMSKDERFDDVAEVALVKDAAMAHLPAPSTREEMILFIVNYLIPKEIARQLILRHNGFEIMLKSALSAEDQKNFKRAVEVEYPGFEVQFIGQNKVTIFKDKAMNAREEFYAQRGHVIALHFPYSMRDKAMSITPKEAEGIYDQYFFQEKKYPGFLANSATTNDRNKKWIIDHLLRDDPQAIVDLKYLLKGEPNSGTIVDELFAKKAGLHTPLQILQGTGRTVRVTTDISHHGYSIATEAIFTGHVTVTGSKITISGTRQVGLGANIGRFDIDDPIKKIEQERPDGSWETVWDKAMTAEEHAKFLTLAKIMEAVAKLASAMSDISIIILHGKKPSDWQVSELVGLIEGILKEAHPIMSDEKAFVMAVDMVSTYAWLESLWEYKPLTEGEMRLKQKIIKLEGVHVTETEQIAASNFVPEAYKEMAERLSIYSKKMFGDVGEVRNSMAKIYNRFELKGKVPYMDFVVRYYLAVLVTDEAMAHVDSADGGIDMNSANLNLRIKRDGNGQVLPLSKEDLAQLSNIQGLEPVVLKITPAAQSPVFLHSS